MGQLVADNITIGKFEHSSVNTNLPENQNTPDEDEEMDEPWKVSDHTAQDKNQASDNLQCEQFEHSSLKTNAPVINSTTVDVDDMEIHEKESDHRAQNENQVPDKLGREQIEQTLVAEHTPEQMEEQVTKEAEIEQEDPPVAEETAIPINYVLPPKALDEEVNQQRRRKRAKLVPVGLQDYKGITFHNGYSVTSAEFCDIAHRKNVLPTGGCRALYGEGLCCAFSFDFIYPVSVLCNRPDFS
ncbi:hypothetical protein Bca52824_028540 [Brassica carinata]|uniref:Uncharacterized protein n=1 Tax=Brassica carinata TaxID=52824 RepID=A0A8X7VCD6_BRACI|nr:hypothetical protein Bca52824_028540 [Brassica carinata]